MKDRHELSCHSGRRVDCMLFCLGDGEGGSTWYYQVKWQLYLSIFHLRRLTYYWGGLNQPPSVLGLMLSKYYQFDTRRTVKIAGTTIVDLPKDHCSCKAK